MAELMYGTGMRLMECCRLRIKDIDFSRRQILVREGKGDKDRAVPLPACLEPHLKAQIDCAVELHQSDLKDDHGRVWLPHALARKYPHADRQTGWQYLFPSIRLSRDPRDGHRELMRHHIDESSVQKAVRAAVRRAGSTKKVSCHTLRKVYSYYRSSLRMRYLKGNSACLGSRLGSWRPLRTAATAV